MTRKKSDPAGPGNNGRWFLEVAGVVDPPPSPTSTYTQLEALDVPPPVVASESASMSAGAAAVSGTLAEDAPDGEFVPVASRPPGPLDDWEPDDVSPRLNRRGWGRWVAVLFGVVVVAAIVAGIVFVPRMVQTEADMLAADYRTSLTNLRHELPTSQTALAVLTDPSTSAEDVSSAVPAIGDLNTRASIVVDQATTPLPDTLPFVPRAAFEALEPTRATMLVVGAEAEDISSRLATTFTYRSTVPALFDTGDLPVEADPTTVDALSVSLAESLADTARLVADLPPDPTFAATRDLATTASARYATWQLEYLDALRQGDTERATVLLDELATTTADIDAELEAALATVRSELDPAIISLARETEEAIAAIP